MARKKIEPITGITRDPKTKLTVQKSYPLYSLWRSDMTLAEFKILDTYLSRIDSHKPDKRLVRFEKGELEQILGVKKINTPELKERVKHLMGNVVEVQDGTAKRGFRLVTLFETAECEQDENGIWQINLECTQKAMKYFFSIESLGYLRYKLRCVTCLASRYSYILFMYLEKHRHMGLVWTVDLAELKQILNCDTEETYKQFKRFNDLILKKCHKELTEKTECQFSYEPVKKGRCVVAIRFSLEKLKDLESPNLPGQITIDQWLAENDDSKLPLWATACRPADQAKGCDFTPEEVQQIDAVLCTINDDRLPRPDTSDSIDIRRYHYMAEKYAAMMRYDRQKPIKHKANYMLQMLRSDT